MAWHENGGVSIIPFSNVFISFFQILPLLCSRVKSVAVVVAFLNDSVLSIPLI